jgi:hypothetical protein
MNLGRSACDLCVFTPPLQEDTVMLTKEQVLNIIDRNKYWLDLPPPGHDEARKAHIEWIKAELVAFAALIGLIGIGVLLLA